MYCNCQNKPVVHFENYYNLATFFIIKDKQLFSIQGAPDVSFEKIEEKDGSQCFFATIQSIPAPCFVQWSLKGKHDELFTPIDVCAEDYKGTLNTLPHPVLIVKNKDQFEYNSYQIEVANFVGSTIKQINGKKINLFYLFKFKIMFS